MTYLYIELTAELQNLKPQQLLQNMERKMTKLMSWVCLIILALLTFTRRSEARPLNPIVEAWNIPNKSLQPILVGAKAIVNMGLELKMSEKRQMYESNRVSPGGPDPWHHSMEHDAEQTAIDSLDSHTCLKSLCKTKRH